MKSKLILLAILFCEVCFGQQINEQLTKAINNATLEIRGKLSEENNEFVLDYYDPIEQDSHARYLKDKGFHGGGPSWLGIIYGAIKLSEPELLNELDVDTVTEGVSFFSKNKESLIKIGRLIATIKSDEALLNTCIEEGKKHSIMK